MAKQDFNINNILPFAAIGLLVFGASKLTNLFNFGGTDPKTTAALNQLQNSNVFSPNYYKGFGSAHLLTVASAQNIAKIIYDAKGLFNDDEAAIYGAFQALSYKTQVSFLAEVFFNQYKQSLYGFLQNVLNETELAQVANIISKLK